MSNNVDGESNEMIEHIFEELNNPESLLPSQILAFLKDNLEAEATENEAKGISPRGTSPR